MDNLVYFLQNRNKINVRIERGLDKRIIHTYFY